MREAECGVSLILLQVGDAYMLICDIYMFIIYILFLYIIIITAIAVGLFVALIATIRKLYNYKNTSLHGR